MLLQSRLRKSATFRESQCGFGTRAPSRRSLPRTPHRGLPDPPPPPRLVLPGRPGRVVGTAGSAGLGGHGEGRPGSPGARGCAPAPGASGRRRPTRRHLRGPPRARGSSPFAPGPAAAERRTLLAESPPASQGSGPRCGRRRPGSPLQGPDPRTPEEEAASEEPDQPAPRTRLSPGERPPTRPHPPGVTPAGPGKSGARGPRGALPRGAGLLLPTLSSTP